MRKVVLKAKVFDFSWIVLAREVPDTLHRIRVDMRDRTIISFSYTRKELTFA